MSSNGVCCSNNGCPSWQTANNASLGQADALLFHGFQQSLVLVSHLIKFIYSTNSWKQLEQDTDLSDSTLTEGQACATIQCYIKSPAQNPRDCRRHGKISILTSCVFIPWSCNQTTMSSAWPGDAAFWLFIRVMKQAFLKETMYLISKFLFKTSKSLAAAIKSDSWTKKILVLWHSKSGIWTGKLKFLYTPGKQELPPEQPLEKLRTFYGAESQYYASNRFLAHSSASTLAWLNLSSTHTPAPHTWLHRTCGIIWITLVSKH